MGSDNFQRTSPNEEENNPTAAGAPADSNFSQNGREFLVGGGRRNPVLNSIQNKDQVGSAPLSTGTTASTNAIGSAPASDLSPRQQFLRNARQGARTTSVYGANKLEPEAVQQKHVQFHNQLLTLVGLFRCLQGKSHFQTVCGHPSLSYS